MSEEETVPGASTAAIQHTLYRLVRGALKEAYEAESESVLDSAAAQILTAGSALLGADGKVRFLPSVEEIAPKLRPKREIKGSSDEAKISRASEIERALSPLRRAKTNAAEMLATAKALPAKTDAEKCRKAALLTQAFEAAGLAMEDPDGG